MQPSKLLIASSVLLLSCGGMPVKPKVTICVVDYPRTEAICDETDGESIKSASQLKYVDLVKRIEASSSMRRVPLSELDKSLCFAPKEWEKVQNYIDSLVDYIKGHLQ